MKFCKEYYQKIKHNPVEVMVKNQA